MEKNAVKPERRFNSRLLKKLFIICQIFLAFELNAKTLSKSEIKNLELKADSEIFFTAQENGYTLFINGIESSDIQTDLGLLPAGVKLISSKKEEFFDDDNKKGTVLHLWFTFTDTGIAKLPPLITKIKGRTYYLPFEAVPIYENPNLISPLLSVSFSDEGRLKTDKKTGVKIFQAELGEEIIYTVNIQYFLQILNYSWQLPKDSIFSELKRFDIARPDSNLSSQPVKKEFTPQKFPVARFSWKPLKEGDFTLPPVYIEAVSYNGSRKHLILPAVEISVSKGKNSANILHMSSTENHAYDAAFTKPQQSIFDTIRYVPSREDCMELARLRSEERHSGLWSNAAQKRADFERSIGLSEQEAESKNPFTVRFGAKYGIFAGGEISPVPEEKALTHNGNAAQRVKIIERAGEWIYIENKDFSGWVKSKLVFEIK